MLGSFSPQHRHPAQSGYDPQQQVSILILNLALLVGCLLKAASDPNIDCPQLPLFNSINQADRDGSEKARDRMKDRQGERERQAEEEVNEAIRRNRELND